MNDLANMKTYPDEVADKEMVRIVGVEMRERNWQRSEQKVVEGGTPMVAI